jgi:hypothetical protein
MPLSHVAMSSVASNALNLQDQTQSITPLIGNAPQRNSVLILFSSFVLVIETALLLLVPDAVNPLGTL